MKENGARSVVYREFPPARSLTGEHFQSLTITMKKLYVLGALVVPLTGIVILGANMASAHGLGGFGFGFGSTATPEQIASRQTQVFQQEANILGISVDQVKTKWASGESFQQMAKDVGLTSDQLNQKLGDARKAALKTNLQTLVSQGVITQAQADQRLQVMDQRIDQMKTNGSGFRFGRGHFLR